MRKLLFVLVFVFAFISVCFSFNNESDEIRVRVVPNSNSSSDLEVKEEVKSAVLSYLELVYDKDYDKCKDNISNTLGELELDLNNKYEDISVSFGYHTLYNKAYNENSEELTLYIVIGDGKGDNWWGSIYPEYISGSEEIEYESILVNVINKIKEN